ncbi:probable basic-leucine zipper transcription factor R [Maniola jurtina]|uniref:probable basic-leucine zipper transcription factor R n=1 Tax=Maniola jurtina TaxID=191418 RepID=UPI001E68D178|nr:probable basic-leucine zipper transcription factor R [Maniola jurtina]
MYPLILILILVFDPLTTLACPIMYPSIPPYHVHQGRMQPEPVQQMRQPCQQQLMCQQQQQLRSQQQQLRPQQQQLRPHQSGSGQNSNDLLSTLLKVPSDLATNLLGGSVNL